LVNPNLSVKESHLITETIEEKLKGSFPISHIQIHVEPH
jgi:divalent metal cation (Fe/Co/Zn/Cd) transporter